MQLHFLAAIVLVAPSLAIPLTSAGVPPEVDAGGAWGAAVTAATFAYSEADPLATGTYNASTALVVRSYADVSNAGITAYGEMVPWALGTYGAVVDSAQNGYAEGVDHAHDGYSAASNSSTHTWGTTADVAGNSWATSVGAAGDAYRYSTTAATGAYVASAYLTEDVYAYAVEQTLVVYPSGVASLPAILEQSGMDASTAYALVFNPVALIQFLDAHEEFGEVLTVIAPTPASAALQLALHPMGAGTAAADAPFDSAAAPASQRSDRDESPCDWDQARFDPARAWPADHYTYPSDVEPNSWHVMTARGLQVSTKPFGAGCGVETNVWHSTVGLAGQPRTRLPLGTLVDLEFYMNMTGARFSAESPLSGKPVQFRYGFGSSSDAPPGSGWGLPHPTIFVADSDAITPMRDAIRHVSVSDRDASQYDCSDACPIVSVGGALARLGGHLLKSSPLKFFGTLTPVMGIVVWASAYIASEYHTTTQFHGISGAGVRFETSRAAAEETTAHIAARIPYELDERGLYVGNAYSEIGFWGHWIEADHVGQVGANCFEAQACGLMQGVQAFRTKWLLLTEPA